MPRATIAARLPRGFYAPIFEYSKRKLRHPPVRLSMPQRRLVCNLLIERLLADAVEIIALAVVANHFHLLARFAMLSDGQIARYGRCILRDGRDPSPRHYLGLARKYASDNWRPEVSSRPAHCGAFDRSSSRSAIERIR